MRRILFTCFGLNVYSYPAMLYLGFVAGIFGGTRIAYLSGLNPDRFVMASVILLVPGLLGARILFVLMHWEIYAGDVSRIWRHREGGMAMYGGFILAVAFSVPLLRALDLPFARFWDAGTFSLLITMIFARVGCLLNGCCSGRATSGWFGLNLPDHRGLWRPRFPTQLIEMAWAAFILLVALALRDRAPFAGATFCGAVGAYGIGRFFFQKLRDDQSGGVETNFLQKVSVILALLAVIGGLLVWLR